MTNLPEFLTIPEDEYHADHTRVGHSTLRMFAKSRPAVRDRETEPATSAMTAGKAGHIALLEPHRVPEFFVSKFKTRCKGTKQEEEDNPGRLVVTESEMDDALAVAEAIENNPACWDLLKQAGQREATLHSTHAQSGLRCKARPDLVIKGDRTMLDAKSAEDYGKFVRDYLLGGFISGQRVPGYALTQAGHYLEATGDPHAWKFGILLCVKRPKPEAGVIWLSPNAIKLGAQWCSDQLLELAACRAGKIPWSTPWSRWPQEYSPEDGLQFVHKQLTQGGQVVRGL